MIKDKRILEYKTTAEARPVLRGYEVHTVLVNLALGSSGFH